MKKNLLTILLIIAVILFALAGWKFWSDNKGDIIDTVIPGDIEVTTGDTLDDDKNDNSDEDDDSGADNEKDGDNDDEDDKDDDDTAVSTGSDIEDKEEDDKDEGDTDAEEDKQEVEEVKEEPEVQPEPTVSDEDFDPKTYEDEEISELIKLLEELLGE